MVGRQYRKKAATSRPTLAAACSRRNTGRDLGYPGGRDRPARYRGDGDEAGAP